MTAECDGCGYETRLKHYESQRRGNAGKNLCILCASTFTGNAVDYPEQYPDATTMKTICYVGNTILDAIRATQVGKGE